MMKFYEKHRVEKVEKMKAFVIDMELSKKRKQSYEKGEKKRKETLKSCLNLMEFNLPTWDWDQLVFFIGDTFSFKWHEEEDRKRVLNEMQRSKKLHADIIGYIIYNHTTYFKIVRKVKGKVGSVEALFELQINTLEKIAEHYPQLQNECDKQISYLQRGDYQYLLNC